MLCHCDPTMMPLIKLVCFCFVCVVNISVCFDVKVEINFDVIKTKEIFIKSSNSSVLLSKYIINAWSKFISSNDNPNNVTDRSDKITNLSIIYVKIFLNL